MSSEQENQRRQMRGRRSAGKRKVKAKRDERARYSRYEEPFRLELPPERCPFVMRIWQGSPSPCGLLVGHDEAHEVAGYYVTDGGTITGRILVPEDEA